MPRSQAPKMLVFNEDTGEQQKYQLVPPSRTAAQRQPKRDEQRWGRLYDGSAWRLAGLTGAQRRVLDALIERTVPDKEFTFVVKDIAEEIGVTPSRVSQAVRVLLASGVLIRLPDRRAWYIDPRIYWRGYENRRNEALDYLRSNNLIVQNPGHPEGTTWTPQPSRT